MAIAPKRFPTFRLSVIVEIGLFFALALALDEVFFGGHRFADVSPHPFWIIVLLMASQYGTSEGLLAATVSIAVFLPRNIPPQQLDQEYYVWVLGFLKLPILWFVTAAILGEMRERLRRDYGILEAELAISRKRENEITLAYESLNEVRQSLERRVAGQLKTVSSVYQAAREIEKLNTSEVLSGIDGLVQAVLLPEKYSVFLLNQNRLEAAFNRGWTADDDFNREFDETDSLFQSVIVQRRMMCATEPDDERVLGAEGVLAGMLISGETEEIIGMLKVEAVRFRDFTPATIQNFELVCTWIGTAFANARRVEAARRIGRS